MISYLQQKSRKYTKTLWPCQHLINLCITLTFCPSQSGAIPWLITLTGTRGAVGDANVSIGCFWRCYISSGSVMDINVISKMEKVQTGQLQWTIKQPVNLFNSLILCLYLQIQVLKHKANPVEVLQQQHFVSDYSSPTDSRRTQSVIK